MLKEYKVKNPRLFGVSKAIATSVMAASFILFVAPPGFANSDLLPGTMELRIEGQEEHIKSTIDICDYNPRGNQFALVINVKKGTPLERLRLVLPSVKMRPGIQYNLIQVGESEILSSTIENLKLTSTTGSETVVRIFEVSKGKYVSGSAIFKNYNSGNGLILSGTIEWVCDDVNIWTD